MPRYPLVQRLLHWLIAVMAIGVLAGGLTLGFLGFEGVTETFGVDGRNLIYKYHKTFGIVILAAMVIRVVVKLRLGKPDYAQPLTRFEHVASNAVHGMLYLCLLAMPVLGVLATGASAYPIEFFGWNLPSPIAVNKPLGETLYQVHGALGFLTLALVAIHIAAALRHGLIKRDGVLSRML